MCAGGRDAPGGPLASDQLVQLTYKEGRGFVYDAATSSRDGATSQGGPVREFQYDTFTGHGWGLAYNPAHRELVVSDG